MYNLTIFGKTEKLPAVCNQFGPEYDLTDDLSQTNVLVICGSENVKIMDGKLLVSRGSQDTEIPDSKLLFAVCDLTDKGLPESALNYCTERGICVFRNADSVKDFIENGNVKCSAGFSDTKDTGDSVNEAHCPGFPDIDLGPFGNDQCRVVIMMKGIDDPILLAAMMFSGMDVRAIAGGLNKKSGSDAAETDDIYGCALVALREPVTRIPHVDGVLKVRVLQDI